MSHPSGKRTLRTLLTDALMGIIFLLLAYAAVWIAWIYYFRGPIQIVTSRTELQEDQALLAQAREEYTTHFHNLDVVVVAGIQSGSPCLECHGDYPHVKVEKMRSLLNAHAWFTACEVCHIATPAGTRIGYRWIDNKTGKPLTELNGTPGNYGAMIIPFDLSSGSARRVDESPEYEFLLEFMENQDVMTDQQKQEITERIHEIMSDTTTACDQCHTTDGAMDFEELLYSPERARHLESLDMGAMTKTYEEFYFPNIFDP